MAKKILVIDDSALMRRVISDIINEGNDYEVAAIAKLRPDQYKRAYAIYVYRFDSHGRPACAKPCKVCQALIREIGIRRVYYTMPDDGLDMSYGRYKRYNQRYAGQWCDEDCI